MSKNFFLKFFIADRQRRLLKRAELAGCFGFAVCTQVSYVHPVILCTPSKLMKSLGRHVHWFDWPLLYCFAESGAEVHAGIRDIMAIAERRKTALTTIVNTTTTKAETETACCAGRIPIISTPVGSLAASDGRWKILQVVHGEHGCPAFAFFDGCAVGNHSCGITDSP